MWKVVDDDGQTFRNQLLTTHSDSTVAIWDCTYYNDYANKSMLYSIIGFDPTFNSGFGVVSVNGFSLSPLPPAITTASIGKYDFCFLKLIVAIIMKRIDVLVVKFYSIIQWKVFSQTFSGEVVKKTAYFK